MNKLFNSILIVDDDEDVLLAARLLLKQHSEVVHTEKNPEKIPTVLKNGTYDVILLDMNFSQDVTSGREGFHWLKRILEIDPNAVVVLITAFGGVETAVTAIKEGATDFVLKPWQNEKLLATLSAASRLRRSRLEVDHLRTRQKQMSEDIDQQYHHMIGSSSAMKKVFDAIEKVAATDANVLILGENGTGKDAVARALHRQSNRVDDVFVSVDVGAISENLFESELFGHERGAFTGADKQRIGRFEQADGGTLFLDEIGDMSANTQAKILRVLQEHEFERLGGTRTLKVDVRLITATNRDLTAMVESGAFRQDLYYRLNVVTIEMPPLRERKEDVAALAGFFIKRFSGELKKKITALEPDALKLLMRYHWPGNIRESENTIERAVQKGSGTGADADHLQEVSYEGYAPGGAAIIVQALTDNRNRTVADIRSQFTKSGGNLAEAGAVGWGFESKGTIIAECAADTDPEEIALLAVDSGAEDFDISDQTINFTTEATDLDKLRSALETMDGVTVDTAELAMVPKMMTELEDSKARQTLRLLEALEDLDDVQKVFSNADFSDEVLAEFAAA